MNSRISLKIKFMFAVLTIILFSSPAVMAREGKGAGKGGGNFIEKFDSDGDGQVSKDEFPGPDDHFTRMDQNSDGYISEDEKPTGPPPRRGQKGKSVSDFDKDGDDRVSMDEFPGPDEHFERFDANGDGYLEEDEMPKGPPPGKGRRPADSNDQT